MHQLSRMSLLVPVFAALQNGVFRLLSSPNVVTRARAVAEDVGDEERRVRRQHARSAPEQGRWRAAAAGLPSPPRASVRYACDLFPQADFGGTERERIAVEVAVFADARVAERVQSIAKRLDADEHQRANGRHVQRAAERGAHADESFEVAIVVLRQIYAGRGIEVDRRVVQQRCVRQIAPFERELDTETASAWSPPAGAPARRRRAARATQVLQSRRTRARRRSRCRRPARRHRARCEAQALADDRCMTPRAIV